MRVWATSFRAFVCAALLGSGGLAFAQEESAAEQPQTVVIVQSAILVVDSERLFADSDYGRRIRQEVQQESLALVAENREIEADLTAEELELTEKRGTMSAEDFRPLAAAFDEKAQRIRAEQTAKANEILSRPELARQQFMRLAQDVLVEIMRERRALAILSKDTVVMIADTIDITEVAIEQINALIGAGTE